MLETRSSGGVRRPVRLRRRHGRTRRPQTAARSRPHTAAVDSATPQPAGGVFQGRVGLLVVTGLHGMLRDELNEVLNGHRRITGYRGRNLTGAGKRAIF
jgi:hypothetical protein